MKINQLISLEELLGVQVGSSVCDMHYGSPFVGSDNTIQKMEIPSDLAIRIAETAMGRRGYMNKMMVLVHKSAEGATLVWNYDNTGYILTISYAF